MFIREIVLSALLVASSGAAFAQQQQQGTPEQARLARPTSGSFVTNWARTRTRRPTSNACE